MSYIDNLLQAWRIKKCYLDITGLLAVIVLRRSTFQSTAGWTGEGLTRLELTIPTTSGKGLYYLVVVNNADGTLDTVAGDEFTYSSVDMTQVPACPAGATALYYALTYEGMTTFNRTFVIDARLDSSAGGTGTGSGGGVITKVLTSQFDKTDDTLAAVTGLSVDVVAGNTYVFYAVLQMQSDAGGIKFGVDGSCTASAFAASSLASVYADALGETIFDNIPATGFLALIIDGSITVSASGTLYPTFAQHTTHATASSVLVGSSFTLFCENIGAPSTPVGTSGVYTPTITPSTNVDTATASQCFWTRVADVMTVNGYFEAVPLVMGVNCYVTITLPIASYFSNIIECVGVGNVAAGGMAAFAARFLADISAHDVATVTWTAADTATHEITFTFSYRILAEPT